MKYILFYHKEDNDGVFSGALFYDYLMNVINVDKSEIRVFPADYNDLKNFAEYNDNIKELQERYENIIMTDISFTEDYMAKLYKVYGNKMVWCDHHAPIISASFVNEFSECPGIRNTDKSAILCAYEFLYDSFEEIYSTCIPGKENKDFPQLLRILSAWDSWSYEREGFEFEYVSAVNKGVTHLFQLSLSDAAEVAAKVRIAYSGSDKRDIKAAYTDLDLIIKKAYDTGRLIDEYESIKNTGLVEKCGDMTWAIHIEDEDKGHPLYRKCCAMFKQGGSSSAMFYSLKKTHPDVNHGLVFKRNPDSTWTVSLYNINDNDWFHCGEFMKERYGGGGHKGAAGCTISQAKFIEVLRSKIF